MNQLGIYAKNLKMEINEKKTNVLVSRKGCKKKWLPQSGKLEIK